MTQNPTFQPGSTPEAQWQAAQAAAPAASPEAGTAAPAPAAPQAGAAETAGKSGGRPSTLVLAGAGSLLAVLAFLGGMAVGHSWNGTSNQQNQFGGGGGRQFPGQQGQVPGGTGQGNTGQGQGNTGQQGTLPGQGQQGQGIQPGTGTQPSTGTQTS